MIEFPKMARTRRGKGHQPWVPRLYNLHILTSNTNKNLTKIGNNLRVDRTDSPPPHLA